MKSVLQVNRPGFAKWLLIVLGAGWLIGAGWFELTRPAPYSSPYFSYESQLEKCRARPSSESRYTCTSQLMLARDNRIFQQMAVVLIPPLLMLIGYLSVLRIAAARQERARQRASRAAAQKRMAEWRNKLRETSASAGQPVKKTIDTTPVNATPVLFEPGGVKPNRRVIVDENGDLRELSPAAPTARTAASRGSSEAAISAP